MLKKIVIVLVMAFISLQGEDNLKKMNYTKFGGGWYTKSGAEFTDAMNNINDRNKRLAAENKKKVDEYNAWIDKIRAARIAKKKAEDRARIQAHKDLIASNKARMLSHKNSNSSIKKNFIKKTYNPKDYIGKPQLILGSLHIQGIKSIQPFKNNKLIIKAANGTFALPRDKFDKAEKINFTDEMKKGSL